jgi:hypothetical protein
MQSRPPDLCGIETCRYRTVVWAQVGLASIGGSI